MRESARIIFLQLPTAREPNGQRQVVVVVFVVCSTELSRSSSLGGSINVEVDVKQIGTMAYNAADVNNDGKLGLDDVGAAAKGAASAVTSTVSGAASKVAGWFGW